MQDCGLLVEDVLISKAGNGMFVFFLILRLYLSVPLSSVLAIHFSDSGVCFVRKL